MPLVFSLKMDDDFYAGETRFVVHAINSKTYFELRDSTSGAIFEITDKQMTEIMPDVFVSAGDRVHGARAKVTIDAPRELLIVRGDSYRNPPANSRTAKADEVRNTPMHHEAGQA